MDYRALQKLEITIENERIQYARSRTPVIRIPRRKALFAGSLSRCLTGARRRMLTENLLSVLVREAAAAGHDRRRKFCSHACYIHSRFWKAERLTCTAQNNGWARPC